MQSFKVIHLIVTLSLLQSPYALAAETNFLQQTNQQAANDPSLQPLVCKKVQAPCYFGSCDSDRLVDDPQCVAENNRRAILRSRDAQVAGQTQRLTGGGDATSIQAPKAPEYKCGGMPELSQQKADCQRAYDAANNQYNRDLIAYNRAQQELKEKQRTQEEQAVAQQKEKSATATLAEIKSKNDQGSSKYQKVATITKKISDANLKAGVVCAATCGTGGGCCGAAPGLFATAAAFRLLNALAKRQVKSHNDSSESACKSLNQLSSTQTSCAPPTDPTANTTVSIDPATGKCTPADSEICKEAPIQAQAPSAVRDALSKSAFAGVKGPNELELVGDDSVKLPNGKVFKASDFQDEKSLIAAGLSPAQAKELLASIGPLASGFIGSKGDLKSFAPTNFQNSSFNSGGGSSIGGGKGESAKTYKEATVPVKEEERKPASEGLAKDFNGELIGVSGDDIFLMMNRRYKLKNAQDSFIAQDMAP